MAQTDKQLDIQMEVRGMEEVQRKLEDDALIGEGSKLFLGKAALTVERQAKIYSPVDTGRLRASWTIAVDSRPIPLWAKAGTNVDYAAELEGSNKKPRGVGRIPFFGPAVRDTRAQVDKFVIEAENAIEKEWDK